MTKYARNEAGAHKPTALVLSQMVKIGPDPEPGTDETYDDVLQIWVDTDSGLPVVQRATQQKSKFGETTLTNTVEGADVTETASATNFGETTKTATHEGTDQPDIGSLRTVEASVFGETTMTKTIEGADQTETASFTVSASRFGETTHTRTNEGTDQNESPTANNFNLSGYEETMQTPICDGANQIKSTCF